MLDDVQCKQKVEMQDCGSKPDTLIIHNIYTKLEQLKPERK